MSYTDINPVPMDTAYGVGGYHWFNAVPTKPLHVQGEIYIIGHSGRDTFGVGITAFRIDGITGQITPITTVEYVPALVSDNCICSDLCYVTGDIYACIWQDANAGDTMNISTFTCDEDGNLSPAWIDTILVGNAGAWGGASILKVVGSTNNVLAGAWIEDLGLYYGRVRTIEVYGSGMINPVIIDSWYYDLGVIHGNFWHINGTVYGIEHTRAVGLQTVYTFNINPNGALPAVDAPPISPSLIDWRYINVTGGTNQREFALRLSDTGTLYVCPVCTLVGPFPPDHFIAPWTFTIGNDGMYGQFIDMWDPIAADNIYEPDMIILGPSENNRGKIMLMVLDGWGPPDYNFIVFEIKNSGEIVKDYIYQGYVWQNDWCRLPRLLNISEWTVTPMAILAFEGENLAWDAGLALQTYQIMPVTTYIAPTVQTLPATDISRT